jgi:thiol-disulfide isomerase/thioredoxin
MKIYFKIWFIVLLLAYLNKSSLAQSNVWISGKLLTDQNEGAIVINNIMLAFAPLTKVAQTIVDKSGNFKFEFNIPKPQVLQLFNKYFYITPGDSIFINVTGSRYFPERFNFKGRSANNYIYAFKSDSLKRSLRFKCFQYDFKNGLDNYLDSLNANKTILLNFLNGFSKSHTLTDDCKAYALSQIVYDYYIQLLYPIISKKLPLEQVPSTYSIILDQIKLTDDNMVEKREYVSTATLLLKYKMLKYKEPELQLINNNFTALTKDLLLTVYAQKVISNYVSKDSLATKEMFEKIDAGITSPEFREYFKPIKEQLNKSLTAFPNGVMLTVITDSLGHQFTFKDLMAKSKNKMIVLDFWASWCSACIQGMPEVNKIKKNFSNADVEFVFISLDKTEADWRGGLAKTKIPGNHYWIRDNFNSALVKYLIIPAIPRYVIINKAGKIEKINAFAPNPGDYGLMSQLSKLLSN